MSRGLKSMRRAMAMIELIFAIVIIAISVITIPTMMSIAGDASKRMTLDDDVMARLSAQMIDKFQARWGGEYNTTGGENNVTHYMKISMLPQQSDLNCSRPDDGIRFYRKNPNSTRKCINIQTPLEIPNIVGTGVGKADGNVSKGIEKLNGGTETLHVVSSTGQTFDINATYNVRYVSSTLTAPINANTATATWRLGSSSAMAPDGSRGVNLGDRTHLKRVVVRFWNGSLGVDSTLTFYKSNIGSN